MEDSHPSNELVSFPSSSFIEELIHLWILSGLDSGYSADTLVRGSAVQDLVGKKSMRRMPHSILRLAPKSMSSSGVGVNALVFVYRKPSNSA
jgi:hypothetical protein